MSDDELRRRARLKAALLENGETEADAEALAGVSTFLNRLSDPAPDAKRQAALRALLTPHPPTADNNGHLTLQATSPLNPLSMHGAADTVEGEVFAGAPMERGHSKPRSWQLLRENKNPDGVSAPTSSPGSFTGVWALIRAQLRVVQGEIWLASLFVMALGAVVTALLYAPGRTLPLVLIAPLVAAFGVAFIYGEEIDPPLELLLTTFTSPRVVLLARLALVFGFDLLLGLTVSALLFSADPQFADSGLTLWGMVTAWLAPMTFLAMLALLSSMIFRDALTGAAVSLFLWIGICVAHVVSESENTLIRLPDLLASGAHPLLWALALLCGAGALWFAGREEHWVRNRG
jgi:hypothetical protein